MPEQQVLWTVLPRGADAATLELDVLVSPRLGVNAPPCSEFRLSDFPEFEHWTRTLADHLTFKVQFADGSRHDADVRLLFPLDHDAWDHLFRATTFVRPWSFRDLCKRQIHSYSVRFITAYLRKLYTDIGRGFPTQPPPRSELEPLRQTVGPVTDVRVKEEREPPPREDRDIPLPSVEIPPDPTPLPRPQGCLAWLWRPLRWLCRPLRPLCRLLPRPLRYVVRTLLRLLREAAEPDPGPPPDPTKPKVTMPRTVHPSPYVTKPPIGPAPEGPMERLEQRMAAELAIAPEPHGPIANGLKCRDLTCDFARAKRFHERPENANPPASQPPPDKPRLDFHQALGALGDYPQIMRRLGLVVRLRVPRPATDPGTVRAIPIWNGATRAGDIAPRTRCQLTGDSFTAAHAPGSDFASGMLDLSGAGDRIETDAPKFDVIQLDSDGAAMKAILAAATLERTCQLDGLEVYALDRPQRETLPALRSAGLALVRADRAWHVHRHLVDAAEKAKPKPADAPGEPAELPQELFAEDLVRGYRIEVRPDGGDWLSLCKRFGTYDLVDDAGNPRQWCQVIDQGYVKRTSATSCDDESSPLYVPEVLARWTGWSLVVPRPGLTLESHVGGPLPPEQDFDGPAAPRSETETEFRLVTKFHACPGSLPRLRFGHTYTLRAIGVDLCGEPLAAVEDSASQSDPITYRRFEPAGPSAPLALRKFWPGESLERVVLRSDVDRDSATYDQQVMQATPPDAAAHRTRHFFPPKTSQDMAELHGMLECAFRDTSGWLDPDAGYRISLRESGTFAKPTIPFGKPSNVGEYWINTANETLTTPYLPDPIVAGTALRGLPGLVDHVAGDPLPVCQVPTGDPPTKTEPLLQVPFTGRWPDSEGFRLRIAEPTEFEQPPQWDADDRLLTVYIPKGEQSHVRYSSYLVPTALKSHAIWDWLDDENPSSLLRSWAEAGAHWMITPPRTLVLVHAVQHPVKPARFTALKACRTHIGQTTACLQDGVIELHVPSTGRIEVIGRWEELIEDKDKGCRKEKRCSVAVDYTVDDGWKSGMTFPPAAPNLRKFHEFGDTRHRKVKYLVCATSAYREYLPDNINVDDLTTTTPPGDEFEVSVLNSARPIAPTVLFAVPTFNWPTTPPGPGWATHTQRRGGGGLRVYLDQPWCQSGAGELLGLVLQGDDPLPDALCSRYGLDANWCCTPRPPQAVPLEPRHFPSCIRAEEVTLDEDELCALAVGFQPEWDDRRKVWFCDIELDVEALPWNYWPFLRLAFVRFQPESLQDAMVSKVVLGEFVQVAPERTLSLAWQGDKRHIIVALRGRAPAITRPDPEGASCDLHEPRGGPYAPRVALRVQSITVPTGSDPDEFDWEHTSGHPAEIDAPAFFGLIQPTDPYCDGNLLWEQVVELPVDRDARRMRLEVAEYELILSDREFGRGQTRITYAAHVPLG
ncbi:hypothetical protein U2F26_33535 [Micromonospora sp. 4G57]|uniref:Uncharacterized protein n=1 Tax=Micromonospora sicca TaxID=2202420 RepID=A0ABU5JNX5_9ACTN|nr:MULTISPECIES: hypothetical protein [unclassified Micromonospora]MDZ5447572.1 hypothetical protein [Micromonospora sp. 4G57]MDZ5494350.1 hypothetical protein [Micromonospora sp. 4G53]